LGIVLISIGRLVGSDRDCSRLMNKPETDHRLAEKSGLRRCIRGVVKIA